MKEEDLSLAARLNLETAQIAWRDLQTFFANGSALFVEENTDLILVAEQLVSDNVELFGQWFESGVVSKVSDEQALEWYSSQAVLWSVVVKPWVLVQLKPS